MAVVVGYQNLFTLDFSLAEVAVNEIAMDEEFSGADGVDQHPGINGSEAGITGSESQNQPHGGGLLGPP
jgi:hypothetical protein